MDREYRFFQQISFEEDRYDLWVGTDTLPAEVPFIEKQRVGQILSNRIGQSIDVITDNKTAIINETEMVEPLETLTLQQEEQRCIKLYFYNPENEGTDADQEPVPLRILILWNDEVAQELDYAIMADTPAHHVLPIRIQAPEEPGEYQFQVIAFSFPGYSQVDREDLLRTVFYSALFSRRILVTVE